MTVHEIKFTYGTREGTITTGQVARQATGSVMVALGDTTILTTVVAAKSKDGQKDFLPLQVEFREKDYAKSMIRSGYIKRETRPSEREVLTSRLLDRTIRPLFPKDFFDEVQVIVNVLSMDPSVGAVVPAMASISAALQISGLPFSGPVALAEVCRDGTQFCLRDYAQEGLSDLLDLTVSGTQDAVLMVESSAKELDEQTMLDAVIYGQQSYQSIIEAVLALGQAVPVTPWAYTPKPAPEADFVAQVEQFIAKPVAEAYAMSDKQARNEALKTITADAIEAFAALCEEKSLTESALLSVLQTYQKQYVRQRILAGEARIDGRDTTTVRPIDTQVSFLPRAHGSALFTRGETQAIVTTTLGSEADAQRLDNIAGVEERQHFMLHYNFPPFSVGEVGFLGSTKRREIGHGHLARKALEAVMPNTEDFPYTIRVVSEITESNGSSSMASVCGGSLALMDAGVPVKAPVAGIAMGLVIEQNQYKVLTDILGDEDHLGDMDFKVAGTAEGVTALQMDIKVKGITLEIMQQALAQAKDARLHILGCMEKSLQTPRDTLSPYAPQVVSITINPDKIRDVIGKGGATIREIIDQHKVEIDISDDGVVKITSPNAEGIEGAKAHIEQLTADVEVGQIYEGKVVKIMDFGAFVSLIPGKDGFLHISQIANERVEDISKWLNEGQEVVVKVIEIDKQNRIRVSMKAMQSEITS